MFMNAADALLAIATAKVLLGLVVSQSWQLSPGKRSVFGALAAPFPP